MAGKYEEKMKHSLCAEENVLIGQEADAEIADLKAKVDALETDNVEFQGAYNLCIADNEQLKALQRVQMVEEGALRDTIDDLRADLKTLQGDLTDATDDRIARAKREADLREKCDKLAGAVEDSAPIETELGDDVRFRCYHCGGPATVGQNDHASDCPVQIAREVKG